MQSDAQEASGHPRIPSLIMQWCSTSIWMYIASKATITTEIVLCCTKKDALIMLRHISVYQSRIGFNAVRCSSFCVKLRRSCTTSSWPRHRCGPMWPWRLDFQSPASMSFVFFNSSHTLLQGSSSVERAMDSENASTGEAWSKVYSFVLMHVSAVDCC